MMDELLKFLSKIYDGNGIWAVIAIGMMLLLFYFIRFMKKWIEKLFAESGEREKKLMAFIDDIKSDVHIINNVDKNVIAVHQNTVAIKERLFRKTTP